MQETVFEGNLVSGLNLSNRFSNAVAFLIDAPNIEAELEIDCYLQVYFPSETGSEIVRAISFLVDTETLTLIPSQLLDTGLEMALLFASSDDTFIRATAIIQNQFSSITSNIAKIANALEVDIQNLYTIRINIGGQNYTDTNGNFWLGRQLEEYKGTYRIHDPIDDPNSTLYESSLNAKAAGYTDNNAPAGEYQVSFYAQEWYRDDNTFRFIDITINGLLVEEGLNIWTEAGGQYKPLVKTYSVSTTGGLSIEAVAQDNRYIIICALEIIQIS